MKKFLLFGLIAAVLPAFAEEAADRKTATSLKYVEHELDTRQNKFTAESNKAMEYTDSAGTVEKRTVKSDLGTSTSDTSLPMVGGVNTKLNQKQDDIAPINDHTAVTYTGTAGQIGQKGIYQDTGTYVDQSDNLIDAKTFNAALKRGLDSEFLCSEYKPGTDLCWVWSIHNNASTNLFDKTDGEYIRAYVHATTGVITEGTEQYSFVVPCQPNTTYSLSGMIGGNSHWGSFTDKSIGTVATVKRTGNGTITTGANDKYLIGLAYTSNGTYDYRNTLNIEKSTPYTTLVPAGYTPVEYIQSTGSQYIDTGLAVPTSYKWEIKLNTRGSNTAPYWGYANNNTYSSATSFYSLGANGQAGLGSGITLSVGVFGGTPESNQSSFYNATGITNAGTLGGDVVHTIKCNGDFIFTVDGTPMTQVNPKTFSAFTPNGTAYLFARHVPTMNQSMIAKNGARIYSYKVWDTNDLLVQNFIPARQNGDNKVGMYDTVSGEFFENAGTGVFQAGSDVNNIIYVPQNQ